MAIAFYFTCRGETLSLPVNPSELTVRRQSGNQLSEIVSLGEINLLRDSKLAAIDLEFLLPSPASRLAAENSREPGDYLRFFQSAMDSRRPLRLVVSDCGVNLKMSVESLESSRAAGDHDALNCRLALREYRSYGVGARAYADNLELPRTGFRDNDRPERTAYTAGAGDSLWIVAQRELGSGSRYGELAAFNGLGSFDEIRPGQVLRLPV